MHIERSILGGPEHDEMKPKSQVEGKKELKSLANWIESGPGFSFLGRCNVVTWLLQVAGKTGLVVEEGELVRCAHGSFPF